MGVEEQSERLLSEVFCRRGCKIGPRARLQALEHGPQQRRSVRSLMSWRPMVCRQPVKEGWEGSQEQAREIQG